MGVQFEHEILKKCIAGDAKAQKNLYDHFSRSMFGVCLRYCNSHEDAKDILQDGFIKIFRKLSQFSGKGSFEGWMKRIFINTALEFYRVNKVYQQQSDVDEAYYLSFESFSLEKISHKELLAAMNKLAPGYRSVLNLYAIEGYSHAEIGELMGISEGTSKSQLSRARVVLMDELKKLGIDIVRKEKIEQSE